MLNWKMIALFGGFAFLLSFLAGAMGGVGLGTIFFRALLGGGIFALMGAGIQLLVHSLLPGLIISGDTAGESEEPLPDEGGEIDMELPEENPHDRGREDSLSSPGEEDGGEAPGTKPNFSEKPTPEELEELGENPFSDKDNLDTLPDIEAFSGSFSGFEGGEVSTADSSFFQAPPKESIEINGETQDPAQAARVIHTWMERDKEG